jgi:hypothetical protein
MAGKNYIDATGCLLIEIYINGENDLLVFWMGFSIIRPYFNESLGRIL